MRLLFLICSFVYFGWIQAAPALECQQSFCLAVVDAGSTGSRIHLFAYDKDDNQNPIQIHEIATKKIKPGLATLDSQSEIIDKYLQELMIALPSNTLPVYFYATAGMRLLPQSKQAEIYRLIQSWFNAHKDWKLEESRTLSGGEEAAFAWLAVNNQRNADPVGVVDVGGASTQIAFPVTDMSGMQQEDVKTVRYHGQRISLFVKSFLGLGQTEVLKKTTHFTSCFPDNYPLSPGESGHGDALRCEEDLHALIAAFNVDKLIKPVLEANRVKDWYAVGAPAMTIQSQTFASAFPGGHFHLSELRDYSDIEFCHNNWQNVQQAFPEDEYVSGDCLFPAYYHALFVNGYGMESDENIQTLGAGSMEDWSLGVIFKNQLVDPVRSE